jgi:hypothetical protein
MRSPASRSKSAVAVDWRSVKSEVAMAVSVKTITLWRREVDNRTGVLARTLEPLVRAGVDLSVLMGYRNPGQGTATIELYPISGKKAKAAAEAAGLSAATIPTLLVVGDNRPAQAHAASKAIADAGINLAFFVAQVIGKKYSAVLGFETEADARRAASLIRRAMTSRAR